MGEQKEKTQGLNAAEQAKLEKDGLDVVQDIARFAEQGVTALTPGDIERLKWVGLYLQRPKEDGNFMLRIKLPGGLLTAAQARVIAGISRDYGKNGLDITTRHSLQFHWIRLEGLPDIFEKLTQAGLTTLQAAGDCPRGIVVNPLAGIDAEEYLDAAPWGEALYQFFQNNRDFSNLPRKFKIAITGAPHNSIQAELNDISFVPAEKRESGKILYGFHVLVGGGLSSQPQLATELDLFVLPEQVVAVAAAVAAIFRDHGYREKRNHARLKFLLNDWGVEKFTQELLSRTGSLQSGGKRITGTWNGGKFFGIHPQKQAGFYYLGLAIPCGRLTADELQELAGLAERYGDGTLRTTNSQDILIPGIAETVLALLKQEPLVKSQHKLQGTMTAQAITCTGKEFCPFAIIETKAFAARLLTQLDEAFPEKLPLRIHVSGCVHACAQPQIADIGLQGTMVMSDGVAKEAAEVWLGGTLEQQGVLGRKIAGKVPVDQAAATLVRLLSLYRGERLPEEPFGEFIKRTGLLDKAVNEWSK